MITFVNGVTPFTNVINQVIPIVVNTFAPESSQSAGSRMRLWFVTMINTLFYIGIYFIVKVFPRDTVNDKL